MGRELVPHTSSSKLCFVFPMRQLMILYRLLKSRKAKFPDINVKEEKTSNGLFLAMEETTSWKEQGLLLKAEKLAIGEPAHFHHTLSNYISHFNLFRLVCQLFSLGESTLAKVSGKKRASGLWFRPSCGSMSDLHTPLPGEAMKRRQSFFIRASNSFLLW